LQGDRHSVAGEGSRPAASRAPAGAVAARERRARAHRQAIGNVGATGDANGCHQHFELWSAPGWYTGCAAVDPRVLLKAWDAYS